MIYLNHAATTYPKPDTVTKSVLDAISAPPASQYRSAEVSAQKEDLMKSCKGKLAQLFGIREPEGICFTSGSTQALNMAILGFPYSRRRIVITAAEHNAVLRTVFDGLKERLGSGELEVVTVPCDRSGYVEIDQLREAVNEDTALVVVNHSSNVTGAVQEIGQIGQWVKAAGASFLVDASQSAGALPIDVEAMKIDLLAFTAHKGLYGIEGCGGLYVRSGIKLKPLQYGGTGTDSATMIPETPFYEVGTANIPGIAGLSAGVDFIISTGLDEIMRKESTLMKRLYQGLKDCPKVTVYADRQPEGTALSFNIQGLPPADVGYILSGTYGIVVRTGLHCAPFIHQHLGTLPGGTVRVSISYMTGAAEVESFLEAVRDLASHM